MTLPTFAELHAQVDDDPVKELMRRLKSWAEAAGDDGNALQPYASIVPDETLQKAVAELIEWRLKAGVPGTKDLYERYYDL